MRVEEEYQDVLQNLECTIAAAYRRHSGLSDHGVARILEAMMDSYAAEAVGRPPRQFGLSPIEQDLFSAIREICQWRLGRAKLDAELHPEPSAQEIAPITVEVLNLCIKRLLKSIRMWNGALGSQGYLGFISEFM